MRKQVLYFLLLILFCSAEAAFSADIGGVTLPETMKAGDAELMLNGCGLRKKFDQSIMIVLRLSSKYRNRIVMMKQQTMALEKNILLILLML